MENYRNVLSIRNKFYRYTFSFLFGFLRIFPGKTGNNITIMLLRIFGANLGKGCIVYSSARIWSPKNLTMGDYSVIGPRVDIYNIDIVELGDRVQISQDVRLITASHDFNSRSHELITGPIKIRDGAWIAQGASVLMNVVVGRNTVVAYGSIVTKSIGKSIVVAGIPAKKIKNREF